LFDFENRKVFFPDVHASFKFCALVFGGVERTFNATRSAFCLHRVEDLSAADRIIALSAADFAAVNPNTGTAPIFRSARDAAITTRLYRAHPVLVDRRPEQEEPPGRPVSVWPFRYVRMFDMTNDSGLFRTESWLADNGGFKVASNRWKTSGETYVLLYEGKMVQAYDHRAASVVVNPENLHRPAQPEPASDAQRSDAAWLPSPQYWVPMSSVRESLKADWTVGFKEITAPTNMRTMIAAVLPLAGFGNKLPLFLPKTQWEDYAQSAVPLVANLNAFAFDFVCRQKVQGQTLNLFIVEQLPLIARERFAEPLGAGTVSDLIRREVLRLSYTATTSPPSRATSATTALLSRGTPKIAATAWPGWMPCSSGCTASTATTPPTSWAPSRSCRKPTSAPSAATARATSCWAT
jgi:hypothetical protein